MKKFLLLSVLFMAFANCLLAQDDDLPPPSSKPKKTDIQADDQKAPDAKDFEGFKGKKKVDISKFIIEPNFNLSIAQGRIDAGLSPYVGYKIFEPKKQKDARGNIGLFAGGGITYFYTGYTNIPITSASTGAVVGTAKAHFHTYGGGVFLQYNIWRGFLARARFEVLHRDLANLDQGAIPKNPNNPSEGFYFNRIQKTIPSLLLGVGYNLLQSKNFFMPIMVSYNVLHSVTDKQYSIYPRGFVIQLGFINLF